MQGEAADIPVLVITVPWGNIDDQATWTRGHLRLIYKPFTKAELAAALQAACGPAADP